MYHQEASPKAMNEEQKGPPRTPQRFAARVSGDGWDAQIPGRSDRVRVLHISRIGLELESNTNLDTGGRYPIRLTHGGETTSTTFYVLRCPERRSGGGSTY